MQRFSRKRRYRISTRRRICLSNVRPDTVSRFSSLEIRSAPVFFTNLFNVTRNTNVAMITFESFEVPVHSIPEDLPGLCEARQFPEPADRTHLSDQLQSRITVENQVQKMPSALDRVRTARPPIIAVAANSSFENMMQVPCGRTDRKQGRHRLCCKCWSFPRERFLAAHSSPQNLPGGV